MRRISEEGVYQALKMIDRVPSFHVAKMTAWLQAATASRKPVLLRVDFDAVQGIGSTRAQQDSEAADTYASCCGRQA